MSPAAKRRAVREKALGEACEALVRRALGHSTRPWWILKVRRASRAEDHHGIDVVVQLAEGRVLLQVKRSVRRADEWRREHRYDPRPIAVVQAGEWESVAVVYGRALGALILLRERLEAGASPGSRRGPGR